MIILVCKQRKLLSTHTEQWLDSLLLLETREEKKNELVKVERSKRHVLLLEVICVSVSGCILQSLSQWDACMSHGSSPRLHRAG